MCGIVGVIDLQGRPVEAAWIDAMNDSIVHRGPDDSGTHVRGRVGLGMRRLSIIDVAGGHQPVYNEDRSICAVFNGEIYNYRELRADLEKAGHRFTTHSDTETLVHLYEQHGPEGVSRLRGMFAYALWDEGAERLLLARDRVGIKPLYYSVKGGRLAFASELKALCRLPWFEAAINPASIERFLSLLYVPGPETVYRDVQELPPGHILVCEGSKTSLQRYWTLRYRERDDLSAGEWAERVLHQFRDSVRSHLMSEVPLGAFLSGGIDSSAVVAAMAGDSAQPVKTFSIGYEGMGAFQDERPYARVVAERYRTEHREFVVSAELADVLPKLVSCFDQPFADSSAIPNYYISKLTRQHVTVALSGLGGDELGAGYERYLGMQWAEHFRRLPRVVRGMLGEYWAHRLPDSPSGRPGMSRFKRFLAFAAEPAPERYAAFLMAHSAAERARLLTPAFRAGAREQSADQMIEAAFRSEDADGLLHRLLLCDMQLYLPGDLLTLTDRVSMLHSLEVRVPFLDHPLIELMAQVPARLKLGAWSKKALFKRAFRGLLPREILERRKVGFSVPLALWLRTDLKPMLREVLSPDSVRSLGYLEAAEVARLVTEHLAGSANHESKLWALINLVLWERQRRVPAAHAVHS
jgi:asparagine synthase (glutamine-hydrolysing)